MKYVVASLLVLVALLGFISSSNASGYPRTYEMYMDLGKEALNEKNYEKAIFNFHYADLVYPGTEEPREFINLIKRLKDDQVLPILKSTASYQEIKNTKNTSVDSKQKYLSYDELKKETHEDLYVPVTRQYEEEVEIQEKDLSSSFQDIGTSKSSQIEKLKTKKSVKFVKRPSKLGFEKQTVYLNEQLWQSQPGGLVQVEFKNFRILEGSNIQRFLIITPDFITVERIDKDRLKITGLRRGATFLHVWDDRGRWTFNVEVILPASTLKVIESKISTEEYVDPFRISYNADWNSFYTGDSYDSVDRNNVNFFQAIEMGGETPYGQTDGFIVFNKFGEENELSGFGGGISEVNIGPFEDLMIRGGDTTKAFSPLTVPGQYFRGVLVETKHFRRNLEYTYFHGRDRAIFGFLAPGVLEERESFVEGARVTVFPEEENQFSFNYARGYGEARDAFLKDNVYSVQAQRRVKNILFAGEVAYDDDVLAQLVHAEHQGVNHSVNVNLRNIDEEFSNITSLPANRGEIGGNIGHTTKIRNALVSTYLDLYQEHLNENEDNPDAINIDFNTTVDIPLNGTDSIRSSLYYINTPGEVSARENVRLTSTYNKQFNILNERRVNAFVGGGYQRSRFDLTPSSEYDRYSANVGFNLPIAKNLSYTASYEYSLVDEKESGNVLHPSVFNTNLGYSKQLTDQWAMHSSVSYRDEERTEGNNSFLAGEDSITGTLGATYRPYDDFEFFVDGRMRSVWGENATNNSFNDMDIRTGVRTSWDTPFFWNPKGVVGGYVFKDLNNNQKKDYDEIGISNVKVNVGKSQVSTNENGYYETVIKAKKVTVTVDINTIPKGFVFSTPTIVEKVIAPHRIQRADFGLSTESGIYGVMYVDLNANGKPDKDDEFVGKARLVLDGKTTVEADFEGAYFFKNISPGEHTIRIDVNSLPIQYIPKIKIINKVKVEEGSTYVFHIPLTKTNK